jgi:hypothetical protein
MDSSRAAAECWDQPRLQDILVGEQGEAEGAAAAPRPSEVVIYVASGGEDDDASAAGAGDGGRYPESAGAICGRDGRLLLASRDGEGDTPLHRAARAGNTRTVARLVGLVRGGEAGDARALLRARNAAGETALHEAVRFGDTEMVAALVGGDRELARVVADDGTSPLYLASTWGRHRIAREMHDRDHGLSYSGPDGQNALHAAVLHDRGT